MGGDGVPGPSSDLLPGKATGEGTRAYRARHPALPAAHWRDAGGLTLSSVGWGSYLGPRDPEARRRMQECAFLAMQGGINVLDTASNYRDQASERDLGAALAQYVAAGGRREHLLVTSKAGYLHGDADSALGKEWFQAEYVLPGLVGARDIVGNVHTLAPAYMRHEIARSRRNLGVETVDVLFVHNPEHQLAAGESEDEVYGRLEDAFAVLEEAADAGHIQVYGVATWDGLRVAPGTRGHLQLVKLVHAAGQARMRAGGRASAHHFRAIELPVNLAMPEAATQATQPWRFGARTTLDVAAEQGWLALGAAPLLQGQLRGHVGDAWHTAYGVADDLHAALQFARSVPGLTSALVGTGDPAHMRQNLAFLAAHGPDTATTRTMLGSGWGHD